MIDRSWEDAITLLLWEKGVSRCLFWQTTDSGPFLHSLPHKLTLNPSSRDSHAKGEAM